MPKRKSRTGAAAVVFLAAFAVIAFVAGETWFMVRSDQGRLALARWVPGSDPGRVHEVVGKRIRDGLRAAGVLPDSVREASRTATGGLARWRVGLLPAQSFFQVNHAVTRHLEDAGVDVVSGRERHGPAGEPQLVLRIAHEGSETHELVMVRGLAPVEGTPQTDARLAVVVYGFGDDEALADSFFALAAPFAVALAPGDKPRHEIMAAARAKEREVVLHLPLEPLNYPQQNPGPGAILVTTKPAQVAAVIRRALEHAGPVSAVMNLMGSLATQDLTVMTAVYRELKRERLPFLHASPVAGSVCKSLASELGVAYEQPDQVIEPVAKDASTAALDRRWKSVLGEARARHQTIVLVKATPVTLDWLPRALSTERLQGVSAVPLASVLRRPPV